jgi:hypothetical protein
MADETVENAVQTDNTDATADDSVLTPGETPESAPGDGEGTAGGGDAPEPQGGEEDENGVLQPEKKEEANEDVGAPENYGEFELPEGFSLDDDTKTRMGELFKGLNLSQKGGQKLVNAFTERIVAQKEAELAALAEQRKQWRNELRQRPSYKADRALALKGLNAVVDSPEGVALFTNSWMSDHPALFDVFVKVGRLIGEDSPLPNGGTGSDTGNAASSRFPIKL